MLIYKARTALLLSAFRCLRFIPFFTGTIFSVTGNSKAPLHRVPSEYDVPPLPAPRGRNTPTLDTKYVLLFFHLNLDILLTV